MENIEHDTLIRLFSDDDTKVNKLSMQNLDGSDYAMRYKSYESLDLRDNLSPIGATHYYIRSFKVIRKEIDLPLHYRHQELITLPVINPWLIFVTGYALW